MQCLKLRRQHGTQKTARFIGLIFENKNAKKAKFGIQGGGRIKPPKNKVDENWLRAYTGVPNTENKSESASAPIKCTRGLIATTFLDLYEVQKDTRVRMLPTCKQIRS